MEHQNRMFQNLQSHLIRQSIDVLGGPVHIPIDMEIFTITERWNTGIAKFVCFDLYALCSN